MAAALNKLMSTRFPSSACAYGARFIHEASWNESIVEWAPRECNREADMLANGDTSLFDPERRIPVAAGTLVWNVFLKP